MAKMASPPTKRKLVATRVPNGLAQVLTEMVKTEETSTSEFILMLIREEAKRRALWPPQKIPLNRN